MGKSPKWWKDPVLVTVVVAIVSGAWVVSGRIGALESAMNEAIATVNERIAHHELAASERFARMESAMNDRFAAVSDRFAGIEARLAALEARMDLLLEGLDITVTPRK